LFECLFLLCHFASCFLVVLKRIQFKNGRTHRSAPTKADGVFAEGKILQGQ
jgi:hypothetical protein